MTFTVCHESVLAVEAVSNKTITLRSVATVQSLGTGQVFWSIVVIKKGAFAGKISYYVYAVLNATIPFKAQIRNTSNYNNITILDVFSFFI